MAFSDNLKKYRQEHGITQRELAEELNMSRSIIAQYEMGRRKPSFEMLCKIGHFFGVRVDALVDDDPESENNQLPENILPLPDFKQVPLLGSIACGVPILAEENIEDWVEVPASDHAQFALRCRGDSMKDARIMDGDIVCIHQQEDVPDGQIAAVLIDDEATLKRVYHMQDGSVMLQAANAAYPPMLVGGASETRCIRILGLATYFISKIS